MSRQGSTAGWLHRAAAPLLVIAVLGGCSPATGVGVDAPPTATTTGATAAAPQAVLAATQRFLDMLDPAQRAAVTAERTQANLAQWSNLPVFLVRRGGLRMDGLDPAQQDAVRGVLRAALSPEGYAQVSEITAGDGVFALERGPNYGADRYFVRILGTPAATGPWTVQYGGHHLAVNVTLDGEDMTLAPTLWGAQPASYGAAGHTTEPLRGETTKAFTLFDALDADQQQEAVLDSPVTEIVLGAGQDGRTLAAEGVSASAFTDEQKTLLVDLVGEWVRPLDAGAAAAKLAAVERNLDRTTFAWSGPTQLGNPIYYRVQGPTVFIEFAHQQGQGPQSGGITHIHAIYREPGSDYDARRAS